MPVTFTRTGDVDVNADFKGLVDPATLPPRVVSPAEALHGRYSVTRTFAGRVLQALGDPSRYYLLPARRRSPCMSYFSIASGDIPLEFAVGNWAWKDESDGPCPNGEMSHLSASAQFPLPQPPQESDRGAQRTRHVGADGVVRSQHRYRRNIHAHRRLAGITAETPS